MRKFAGLTVLAIALSTLVVASPQVAVLDGTGWKVDVHPDATTKDKGEKEFKETLTFADGKVSFMAPRVGTGASEYSATKAGEKDVTFKTERAGIDEGSYIWTGTVRGKELDGKLIWTKHDGSIYTYTFKGNKLD